MAVRQAQVADLAEVQSLLSEMHQETVYREIALEPEKLRAFLHFAQSDERHALLIYEGANGQIDGVYIGSVSDYFFSSEIGAWDLIFYVRPGRRGSLCAVRLWQSFRRWAEQKGAKTLWPGASTGILRERTAAFYKGMGLEEVGSVFFLRVGEE